MRRSKGRLIVDFKTMSDNSYFTFQIFEPFEELVCAFSTRQGGYSTGKFSSFNMGNFKKDDRITVMDNRRLYYKKLGIVEDNVALPGQIHSANIELVSSPGNVPNTDALFSSKTGLFLGIQTADCFPVFIYCPEKKITGIIHAGWKGAIQNIIIKNWEKQKNSFL